MATGRRHQRDKRDRIRLCEHALVSGESDLVQLLATMRPVVRAGEFVFVSSAAPLSVPSLATIAEDESTTYVLDRTDADTLGLHYEFVAGWITLQVHSSLAAVGLTAAVSGSLTEVDISCNVLAGFYHDHLLVPIDRLADALQTLEALAAFTARPRRL